MSIEDNSIINGKTTEEIQYGSDLEDSLETNELFAKDSSENLAVKEERIIKKAKRILKINSAGDVEVAPIGTSAPRLLASKNSRRSRNGFGRGLPKKGYFYINLHYSFY